MINYKDHFSTQETPQSEPIPGKDMVPNSAGGYSFAIDKWDRLNRFLILGSEGGTYYISEHKLTVDNAKSVLECIKADGKRVIETVINVSHNALAPKNDPALFVLAMCTAADDVATRQAAVNAIPQVARTGYHLLRFVDFVKGFRGFGRAMRRGINGWFLDMDVDRLAYQSIKYKQREGWALRDLLRMTRPKTDDVQRNGIFGYIVDPTYRTQIHKLFKSVDKVQKATSVKEVVREIIDYNLPREAIPTEHLNSVEVWDALLQKMPMTAMIRNLGKMTNIGLIKNMSSATDIVAANLVDKQRLEYARIHPISVLAALITYEQGKGFRGKLTWSPVAKIIDTLNDAFYLAFKNVEPANKRTMLALDVSGSMHFGSIAGIPGLMPSVGSAAMALVTAATEPNHWFTAFSHQMVKVTISPKQRLDDVVKHLSQIPMGGTDCSLPMTYALDQRVEVDTFVIYTDNETWYGRGHPIQTLKKYRDKMGIPAKLVVVGMTANEFTVADPNDSGMLDVVGFDSSAPALINNFSSGKL